MQKITLGGLKFKSDINGGHWQKVNDIMKEVGENIRVKHPYGRRKGGEQSEPPAGLAMDVRSASYC